MSYQADTIATIIKRLNVQYFLPAIQREFVWKPEQIVQLFDSIMRGYPISSFLFWGLTPENKDNWEIYAFIQDFHQNGTHNVLASTAGVQQLTLVLDGQQRLTSLLIGLKGSYTIKKRYMPWNNPNAWVKQTLYLDLLKDPHVAEDDLEIGTRYGFRFFEGNPTNDAGHYWFKVSRILDYDNEGRFFDFCADLADTLPETTTKAQIKVFNSNLQRLYWTIWKDEIISYYTEHDQDYDRVLDIFVRANEGGTRLSKSDLLLSMVTAKWAGVNAREEIYGFVEHLNYDLTRKNYFDKDFVMKSCLVLTDLPVQYLVKHFTNTNLALIQSQWSKIKKAIRDGVDLVNSFGIDRDTLTSTNALIPVLYFLFQHPKAAPQHGTTPADRQNASLIRHWLLMALLNNVFSGQSDSALNVTRQVLQAHALDPLFPADAISVELAKSGRLAQFNNQAIANFLAIEYAEREAFLALSLLYDENAWGTMIYHQDHIFPQALFSQESLDAAGFSPEQQIRYHQLMNRIANLELLSGPENLEKSNQDFATWLATRDPGFKRRHLIPSDPTLLQLEHFEQFIAAREALIRERLTGIFASTPAQEMPA